MAGARAGFGDGNQIVAIIIARELSGVTLIGRRFLV